MGMGSVIEPIPKKNNPLPSRDVGLVENGHQEEHLFPGGQLLLQEPVRQRQNQHSQAINRLSAGII